MKALMFLVWLQASTVRADANCNGLAAFVGTYKLISRTCDGPYGSQMTVQPYQDSIVNGYMIESGRLAIGPSTASNAVDKCSVVKGVVTVETCAFDSSCIPRGWTYVFDGDRVTFSANGCLAVFEK